MCHAPSCCLLLFQFRAATRSAACWGIGGVAGHVLSALPVDPEPSVECESGSCKTWRQRPLRCYQGQVQLQIKIKIIIIMPGTCPKTKGKSLLTIENLTLFTSICFFFICDLLNSLKILYLQVGSAVAGAYSQPWEWAEDQPLWKS